MGKLLQWSSLYAKTKSKTKQNKTKQNKTKQNKTKQNKNKTKQKNGRKVSLEWMITDRL